MLRHAEAGPRRSHRIAGCFGCHSEEFAQLERKPDFGFRENKGADAEDSAVALMGASPLVFRGGAVSHAAESCDGFLNSSQREALSSRARFTPERHLRRLKKLCRIPKPRVGQRSEVGLGCPTTMNEGLPVVLAARGSSHHEVASGDPEICSCFSSPCC